MNPAARAQLTSLADLHELLTEHQHDTDHEVVINDGDAVRLKTWWTVSPTWSVFETVFESPTLTIADFTVHPEPTWGDETYPVVATFRRTQRDRPSPTLASLDETLHQYHPHRPNCSAGDVEFKCGDISRLFAFALQYEYGLRPTIETGGIYDPHTNRGWPHAFNYIHATELPDFDTPVIIDGTAKQFCTESHFPQTLGAADNIPTTHTITPDHDHWSYYTRDRTAFIEP